MDNNSIETLLLRHYGQNGPVPDALEQKLINSVRQDVVTQQQEKHAVTQQQEKRAVASVLEHRINRRHAVKVVAAGSAGFGLVVASLEVLEAAIYGRDATQSALS